MNDAIAPTYTCAVTCIHKTGYMDVMYNGERVLGIMMMKYHEMHLPFSTISTFL